MTVKKLFDCMSSNPDKLIPKDSTMIHISKEINVDIQDVYQHEVSFPKFERTLNRAIHKHFDYCKCLGGSITNDTELHLDFYTMFPHYPNVNGIENPLEKDELYNFIEYLTSYLNAHIGHVKYIKLWSASSCSRDFGLSVSLIALPNKYMKG